MKSQYLITLVIILILAIKFFVWDKIKNQKTQPIHDTKRPSQKLLPTTKVTNDKLIIVETASDDDIKRVLSEFCNLYNEDKYVAVLRLTKISDKKFAITFPYDIDFVHLCFLVNYVAYPMDFDKGFKATGWTSTKNTDLWITEKSANKDVMLFISDYDTEGDNVYLTTSDNIGYKLGFAIGKEKQLLENPEKYYAKPPFDKSELETKEYIEFK